MERAHLVKGQHLSGHLTAIQESDSHPVVDLSSTHQYWSLDGTKAMERKSRVGSTYVAGLREGVVLAC